MLLVYYLLGRDDVNLFSAFLNVHNMRDLIVDGLSLHNTANNYMLAVILTYLPPIHMYYNAHISDELYIREQGAAQRQSLKMPFLITDLFHYICDTCMPDIYDI